MTYDMDMSATGSVGSLPLIFPGHILNWNLIDGCDITGTVLTCTPKGFMHALLSLKLLDHFDF